MRYFVIHPVEEPASYWTATEHATDSAQPLATISNQFAEAYPEFLKKFGYQPVFIDHFGTKQKWDAQVEALGYEPLPDRCFIESGRLARILYPKQSAPTAQSVQQLLNTLESLPIATLQSLANACTDVPALQDILNELVLRNMTDAESREQAVEVLHELAFRPATKADWELDSPPGAEIIEVPPLDNFTGLCLDTFRTGIQAWAGAPFEDRPGQTKMIASVAEALAEDQLLIVEAGTGTGKSLSYLLPAALFSTLTGEKVVVSTHTIALQEQLRNKDIPILQALLKTPVHIAILKGRNHYLCLRKLARQLHSPGDLTRAERDFILKAAVWLTETKAGDREEIALSVQEQEHWRLLQSDTESCINKKCPFFKFCYYFAAKQQAAEADLILVNHSLVLSDLAADNRILPRYERMILDEAHHLEEQATKHFGTEVFQTDLQKILERTAGGRGILPELRRALGAYSGKFEGEAQKLLQQIEQLERLSQQASNDLKRFWVEMAEWGKQQPQKSEVRITRKHVEGLDYGRVGEAGTWLAETRKQLAQSHQGLDDLRMDIEVSDPLFDRLEDLSGRINELLYGLQVCVDVALVALPESAYVGWLVLREHGNNHNMSLQFAPLSVAKILKQELFNEKSTVILTSATLSVAKSFHYLKERTGLALLEDTGRLVEERMDSPFSYSEQALLCVPEDFPDIRTEPLFTQTVADAIIRIAELFGGRTMVLFTSKQMLQQVYQITKNPLLQKQMLVLAQGIHDHRRAHLLDQFRNTSRTVLFGLDSFWEGVDVQGDALTSLVIVKLPFPVPSHPIVEARGELIRLEGGQPFYDYSIPQAVIRFTQGFGRLIRAKTDRGVVFVLDKRIVTERYGRVFIKSLPEVPLLCKPFAETCKAAQTYV